MYKSMIVLTKNRSDTNEDGNHHYLLFSATFNKEMRKLARKFLAIDHVMIRIGRAGSVHVNVKQHVSYIPRPSQEEKS